MLGTAISRETPVSKHWTVSHAYLLIDLSCIKYIQKEFAMKE